MILCLILYISPSLLARFNFPNIFYFIYNFGYQHSSRNSINTLHYCSVPPQWNRLAIYLLTIVLIRFPSFCIALPSFIMSCSLFWPSSFLSLSLPHQHNPTHLWLEPRDDSVSSQTLFELKRLPIVSPLPCPESLRTHGISWMRTLVFGCCLHRVSAVRALKLWPVSFVCGEGSTVGWMDGRTRRGGGWSRF